MHYRYAWLHNKAIGIAPSYSYGYGQELTDEYEVLTKMTKFYKSLTT